MTETIRIRLICWLVLCALLVFAIVLLGGAVRLTGSGLSMVDWRPVTGLLPPVGETAWQAAFEQYKRFPEYQQVNAGMSMESFRFIYLMEYAHRMLGRVIGLVFLLPFAGFLLFRSIGPGLAFRLWVLFGMGALQGGLGWYMVRSGLVDVPSVSQYRLVLHLLVAVVIYAYMIRLIAGLMAERKTAVPVTHVEVLGAVTIALVMLMIASGGLVAGTHAGLIFNTFPKMGGDWIPDMLLSMTPAWKNFFENTVTIQFVHRCLAWVVLLSVVAYAARLVLRNLGHDRLMAVLVVAAAIVQVVLGVVTLLAAVPVHFGVAHQGGALILLATVLVAVFRSRPLSHVP